MVLLLTVRTAQALSTPVRSCALTGLRFPSYFLLDFGLATHPRAGKPWQLPRLVLDRNATMSRKTPSSEEDLEQTSPLSTEADEDPDPASQMQNLLAQSLAPTSFLSVPR